MKKREEREQCFDLCEEMIPSNVSSTCSSSRILSHVISLSSCEFQVCIEDKGYFSSTNLQLD